MGAANVKHVIISLLGVLPVLACTCFTSAGYVSSSEKHKGKNEKR